MGRSHQGRRLTGRRSDATEEELIAYCKSNITSYKKPKSVDFVAEIPKNNYGKIMKRELREPYWKNHERGI